jgi:hypothetical protein
MVTDDEILSFFRKALPEQATLTFKRIPLQADDVLQDYCDSEDLIYVINEFFAQYSLNPADMHLDNYFPWKTAWFFRKWFTKKPLTQTRRPLTVRMFAASARAGRWLYS